MKTKIIVCLVSCIWASATCAWSATGADILRVPVTPKTIALGGADVASADDVNALQTNPAGLAHARRLELAFSHGLGLTDSVEYAAICQPIKAGGTMGLGAVYRHMPEIDNPGAVDEPIKSEDLLVTLGYALKLNYISTSLDEWSAGVNLKWLKSTLGAYTPTTWAVDLGVIWKSTAIDGLQAGWALQNLGGALRYIEEADALPLTMKLGAAYTVLNLGEHKAVLLADYHLQSALETWSAHAGAEYQFMEWGFARVGYLFQERSLSSVVYGGLGFKISIDRTYFQADYAFKPVLYSESNMEAEHFISLTMGF